MPLLQNHIAVVTGAASGIGRAGHLKSRVVKHVARSRTFPVKEVIPPITRHAHDDATCITRMHRRDRQVKWWRYVSSQGGLFARLRRRPDVRDAVVIVAVLAAPFAFFDVGELFL